MNKKPINNKKGTVLLEMILVIPLFMVLLGGIMWLGDLVLARERLVVSDRYGAWNLGNRHLNGINLGKIRSDVQKIFFDPGHQPYETIDGATGGTKKPQRWWEERYARITLRIKTPSWTKPWLAFGDIFWGTKLTEKFDGVDGRGPLSGGAGPYYGLGNMTLMRTKHSDKDSYFRNWEGLDLADPVLKKWYWRKIKPEPWAPDKGQVPSLFHDGFTYTRYSRYDKWSR